MYNNRKTFVGDFMGEERIKVTLAGKYSGPIFEKIKLLKKELVEKGIDVLYPPEGDMSDDSYGFFESDKRTGDDGKDFGRAELNFVHKTFQKCDAIIFCNYDGYIGQMAKNELYFFTSLCTSYDEEEPNSYHDMFDGYTPIYLLEEIDIESYRSPDELGDFASLLEIAMERGFIKVGLDTEEKKCSFLFFSVLV